MKMRHWLSAQQYRERNDAHQASITALNEEIRLLRAEQLKMVRAHAAELTRRDAEHAEELKALRGEHASEIQALHSAYAEKIRADCI